VGTSLDRPARFEFGVGERTRRDRRTALRDGADRPRFRVPGDRVACN
jgi:hypothetical protein